MTEYEKYCSAKRAVKQSAEDHQMSKSLLDVLADKLSDSIYDALGGNKLVLRTAKIGPNAGNGSTAVLHSQSAGILRIYKLERY